MSLITNWVPRELTQKARDEVRFNRFLTELRSSLENPSTPLSYPSEWLLDIFNGGRTDSGIRVSEMTALQVSTVLSCVKIISGGVATLPMYVYSRSDLNGRQVKKKAHDHPLFDLLRYEPNVEMSAHTFKMTMQCHALLWGNAYGEIQYDGANRPIAIWPRNPARTRPVRLTQPYRIDGTVIPSGTLVFKTSEMAADEINAEDDQQHQMAPERIILAEDMIHLPGLSLDGRLGQSTTYLARQVIGLSLATEKHGAKFFGNGAVPQGVLELPNTLEPRALENLKRSWAEAYGGENMRKTAVLEQGIKYTPIGVDLEKSQFLETRKYQRLEIATLFNVPPHMIGEQERGGKGSVEQTSIEFLNYCLQPWLDIWELEISRKMFNKMGRSAGKYFVKYDTHHLLYPDSEARSAFYRAGKQWGFLNTNDIHELEDMNPVSGKAGEEYWMPVNMMSADDPITMGPNAAHEFEQDKGHAPGSPIQPEKPMGGAPQNVPAADKPAAKSLPSTRQTAKVYRRLFSDCFGRVASRKSPTEQDFYRIFSPVMFVAAEDVAATVASEMGKEPIDVTSVTGKIIKYIGGMRRRSADWTVEMADALADVEGRRALNAIESFVLAEMGVRAIIAQAYKPLYLMRHASTLRNEEQIYRGWGEDDIDSSGVIELRKAIDALKPLKLVGIIASDLQRAQSTAQILSNSYGDAPLPILYDKRFRAWNVGPEFVGRKKAEAKADLQYYVDNPDQTPNKGESLNDLKARTNEAYSEYSKLNQKCGPQVIIMHGSNLLTISDDDFQRYSHDASLIQNSGVVVVGSDGKSWKPVYGSMGSGDYS